MDVETQEITDQAPRQPGAGRQFAKYGLDVLVLLAMCALLFYGASWQFVTNSSDAAKYECYVVAFWQGNEALKELPSGQCNFILHPSSAILTNQAVAQRLQHADLPEFIVSFVVSQAPEQALHALPHEYPLLVLIPFSLGALAPAGWYQIAFAAWMALLAISIYILLLRFRSRRAAIAFAIYLVAGAWSTGLGRFDLVPSLLTLGALLFAIRKRWNWAFVLLALATLTKFYPLVLLLPFLLAQQMEMSGKWYGWQRWRPLALFVGLCILVMGISLLLSVEGTLGPLSYFGNRPIQVESLLASLLWLISAVKHHPLEFAYTFGSLNVLSTYSTLIGLFGSVLNIAGLLYTFWLQWRGKINLVQSCLLTLLVVMLTGKVFSPQYLIWVAPLVAYVGESDLRWLISWTVLSLLTTFIYPYIYYMTDNLLKVPYIAWFFPTTAVRNFLLLGVVLCLLLYYGRNKPAITLASAGNRRSLMGQKK
ncbi:DUF2029 domain-containing protein [Ktedonosporobacter rubrisoli]|uniref:DUF2029 domain-containing protein n=1 Tax=Ktedonosporobacter rubrisoli TaxID=2509675 RepID=A0A4P6JRW2_KTERU|nr:glycosyltransferase 87 family protein [Ktedonosporobacter rubrisoli]QBD78219.1 DUF2029 domain-containing protein [Ktedonosporobacter rubrisoli]